ncbi:MAG: HDIG domain-containing protein [Anaerolineales bacterium]|nr:MAG: HDIG domain-containing protein [Anaerolineales bacterium]
MDENTSTNLTTLERLRSALSAARLWFILLFAVAGTIAAISIPVNNSAQTYGLQISDVAPQDIHALYDLSYVSEVLTERERTVASENVPQVYDQPDINVTRQQLERLQAALTFIDSVRSDPYSTNQVKLSDLSSMSDIRLDTETALLILELSDLHWQTVKSETLTIVEQVMRNEIREGRVEEARRTIPALVSISLPENQATTVETLAPAFVTPNTFLNIADTEAARTEARESVEPVIKSYVEGETIVSRGEVVGALDIEALMEYDLLKPPNPWLEIAIRSLLVILLIGIFTTFAYRIHPKEITKANLAFTLSLLFIIITLSMQALIPDRTVFPYVFPYAALPILVTVFFSPSLGVMISLLTGTLAGFLAPRGLELALYAIISGILASLMIKRAERLSSFISAGLAAALGSALVIVIFRLPDPAMDIIGKTTLLGVSIVSGLLSTSLGFGLLLIIGNLLGITTNLQLLELSRPDHPLLQKILREAPGTYQHSLQVANLAEQAAREIGANALLTRVGAQYHDVGKSLHPQFFIENQVPGQNVHEQLDPKTSANIILSHVPEGLSLARKYRIPQSIRAFIPEHHGTLKVSYQYSEALEAANGDTDQVDRRDYTYKGPVPLSRETALLMLADGSEAAVRAKRPQSKEEINQIVRRIISDRMEKGQFDKTDLTLRDLNTIRRSFVKTLTNIYHPRIQYPKSPSEDDQSQEDTQPVQST